MANLTFSLPNETIAHNFRESLIDKSLTLRSKLKKGYFFQIAEYTYVCYEYNKIAQRSEKCKNKKLSVQEAAAHLVKGECRGRKKEHRTKTENVFIFSLNRDGTYELPKMYSEKHGGFDQDKYKRKNEEAEQARANAIAPPSQTDGSTNSASVPAGGQSSSSSALPTLNSANGPTNGVVHHAAGQPSDEQREVIRQHVVEEEPDIIVLD